ncbi:MAG: cysteine desulfurase [Bacteroidetes bacterium]|nr:cysteine desulfurase [Bacteroidota bacterium]
MNIINMIENKQITEIRKQFPILQTNINKKPLVYLDNASTTQKPNSVINKISEYYKNYNSNIERGFHTLGSQSFEQVNKTRETVSKFINSQNSSQIIFTSGTTESINIVANGFANELNEEDIVILSELEHHSNIVPWINLCRNTNSKLEVIPILKSGELDFKFIHNIIKKRPKIIALTYASNVIGTINDIEQIIKIAHEYNIKVFIDAAQAVPHFAINVQKLDCDFLAFSSHKMYGPMGVGVLYCKEEILQNMKPLKFGGAMIEDVSFCDFKYREHPYKFEAGTMNISNIIAFNEAIEFINQIGFEVIEKYEKDLFEYLIQELQNISQIKIIGNPKNKVPLVSFIAKNMHPFDIGMMLNASGIAVRTGNHCAQPLMDKLNLSGTVRVSLSIYNTKEEIDFLVSTLKKILL